MKSEIKELGTLVQNVIQITRSMTFEISPPVLYELGFEPAVGWLTGQFQKQYGVVCAFESDGSPKPMTDDTSIILFQSVRELLANVRKHAKARKVSITSTREGNAVRIAVEDDGIGFDPDELTQKITKNEGFGLFNLRERLSYLRGNIDIDSSRGQGTAITLTAPLKRSIGTTKRKRT
jgi:signal transduction histidine kinase